MVHSVYGYVIIFMNILNYYHMSHDIQYTLCTIYYNIMYLNTLIQIVTHKLFHRKY